MRRKATSREEKTTRESDVDISQSRKTGSVACSNDLCLRETGPSPKISGFFPRILPPGPYGNSSPRPRITPPPVFCSRASRSFKITGMATSKWLQIPAPARTPKLECLAVCALSGVLSVLRRGQSQGYDMKRWESRRSAGRISRVFMSEGVRRELEEV
ncbi:hypothetical protein Q7C36_011253 [Tachysurus vachellii]|uniref:Uncharacterized protein n=1 Tax=Tachysurus vachellii TaxID=175792 RepID=A0AA88MTQ8_TACVA|nr:hypothetical protein Q7C36_011253 [Tachysurus vachellii]